MSAPLRLGLLQYGVGQPASVADFARALEGRLEQGRAQAELLVLPEYACVELGAALAGGNAADEASELAAMVAAGPEILAAMREAARRLGVWLLPGTLPLRRDDGRIVNRAPLIAPDGRMAVQEKRAMTRFEAERWGITQGTDPNVFDTPWGRIGISVCYDVEFPENVRRLALAGADLIVVPTALPKGSSGTFIASHMIQVRAFENQVFVAYINHCGADDRFAYAGLSRIAAPDGKLLAEAPAEGETLLFAEVRPGDYATSRAENTYLVDLGRPA